MKSCSNCLSEPVCETRSTILAAVAATITKHHKGGMQGIITMTENIECILGENCLYHTKEN